ncbi:PP2C family protein-serine/threonine phosphatase [Pyruvatibacter sp.]|uniref:PP2C family protein-serine/threonine phosphatase n=1 Tax=Pyruvatibacter sp. TaxID=1981328 RepID=UPI0032ED2B5E
MFSHRGRGDRLIITMLTSGQPEYEQARVWRPVVDRWPDFAPRPMLDARPIDAAFDAAASCGDVVLIVLNNPAETTRLTCLLNDLVEMNRPVIILHPRGGRTPGRRMEGVIVLEEDFDPAGLASTLGALAFRQHQIDTLTTELRYVRRFQGGMCGEMDRLNEELRLAAAVQTELLPESMPSMPNVDFQVLFRPCGYVSGDIYDVQRLDEHHVGFFIADAVGHGVPAALMTMIISRSIVMKQVAGGRYDLIRPAEVLRNLNDAMLEHQSHSSRFATAMCGVIDCRTREVSIAGAGHPPAFVLSPSGVRQIASVGPLLGVFPTDEFDEETFTLAGDEMLVLYSDGFETAFPGADVDKYDRRLPTRHYETHFSELGSTWRESVERDERGNPRGGAASGLRAAMKQFMQSLNAQAGSLHQIDDLTALVVAPSAERAVDALFEGRTRPAAPERTLPAPGKVRTA